MIFTIGNRATYDPAIRARPVVKVGRIPGGYDGGSAFASRPDAEAALVPGFAVYGLLADWDRDCGPGLRRARGERALLVDRPVVRLT